MVFRIVRNVTRNCLVWNALIVIDILVEKCCKPAIIIIFIQHVPDAPNAVIHLVMVRRCICKAVQVSERSHPHRKWFFVHSAKKFANGFCYIFFSVWHPRCGPCPNADITTIVNGAGGNVTDTECDRLSNSAMSEMQVKFTKKKETGFYWSTSCCFVCCNRYGFFN